MSFDFEFTIEKLNNIIPYAKGGNDIWFKELKSLLPTYDIKTKKCVAAFLTETVYETNGYTVLEESLNYNAKALLMVWPNKFTEQTAKAYSHKQEAIANRVYANRMGNGTEESGDGYTYRGRGLIPITGKDNYKKFAEYVGCAIDEAISYLETPRGAVHAACWLWKTYNLNIYAENDDMIGLTNRLSGGMLNIEDKISNFNAIKELL